ncbi:carbohydrate kinase [Actinokineospora sp. PR83]|uniref:carbohydrate kinase family protein n=1 Tax=Actinokineospora sp. PR83 TaxID=2884908 RepID=UPI001F24FDBE|nr:carbohydrate kinase [Actinokineospora sp. PR83]MCG8914415.1 carbohydrate kinase [Actinokineospora sp. PR83]
MITVVGEALADLIAAADGRTFTAHPGGSPANVALGLARLGTASVLGTRLGDDLFGTLVRTHLTDAGVDVRPLPAPTSDTSVAFAATDAAGVARYDFRITWDVTALPPLDGAECLHTGSLATLLEPGARVVEAAMRTERTVSYDPNVRPSLSGTPAEERPRVERQVALSDVVKVSEEDLGWLYPGEDPVGRAARWLALGPSLVVVTLGADGAHAVTGNHTTTRPGPPTTVVDTVGAGDAFTAGLLHWLSRAGLLSGNHTAIASVTERSLENALDFANAVAAITCSRAGANPPTLAELGAARSLLP